MLSSNPTDDSGGPWIVPAVPSPSGVADVFAFQGLNTVQAITADGTTAWTADLNQLFPYPAYRVIPDFQGGLVAYWNGSITKLDGTTGQPYPTYNPGCIWIIAAGGPDSLGGHGGVGYVWAHPDGTIFTIEYRCQDYPNPRVVGIDPTSGSEKFSVPVGASLDLSANAQCFAGFEEWFYGGGSPPAIIAGDGYFYVPYGCYDPWYWNGTPISRFQRLLRVNSSGSYDDMQISQWTETSPSEASMFSIMTNADQGVVLTYVSADGGNNGMAVTTGTSVSVVSLDPVVSDPYGPVVPVLQLQDGSFAGSVWGDGPLMVAFDQTGSVRWSAPNVFPKIATADGGVIAQTYDQVTRDFTGPVIAFDKSGNAAWQPTFPGNAVPDWGAQMRATVPSGSESLGSWVRLDASYATLPGGNPSGNGTFSANFGLTESHPRWNWARRLALGEGADCKLGADTDKVLLAGDALQQYTTLRQSELTFLQSLTTDSPCEKFFLSKPVLASYVPMLANGVRNQVAWDADLSHLSWSAAGLWNIKIQAGALATDTWDSYSQKPVCDVFYDNGDWNHVTATAQAFAAPWNTDVYIFPKKKGWSLLTPATILHEALHNLTGLDDEDLYMSLTGQPLKTQNTEVITVKLREQGCGQ
jgi:hypothetical protein